MSIYACAYLGGGIPDANDFRITGHQDPASALQPVEDEAGIVSTGDELSQCTESRYHVISFFGLIVSDDSDHTVRRAGHKKSLVVLVNESKPGDFTASRIAVGEAIKRFLLLPIPDTALI